MQTLQDISPTFITALQQSLRAEAVGGYHFILCQSLSQSTSQLRYFEPRPTEKVVQCSQSLVRLLKRESVFLASTQLRKASWIHLKMVV